MTYPVVLIFELMMVWPPLLNEAPIGCLSTNSLEASLAHLMQSHIVLLFLLPEAGGGAYRYGLDTEGRCRE